MGEVEEHGVPKGLGMMGCDPKGLIGDVLCPAQLNEFVHDEPPVPGEDEQKRDFERDECPHNGEHGGRPKWKDLVFSCSAQHPFTPSLLSVVELAQCRKIRKSLLIISHTDRMRDRRRCPHALL